MSSNQDLTIYDSWNIDYPNIPTRSRLFSLEPIGIGTPYVESLSSFIIRLAEVHCVPTGTLVKNEIASQIPKTYQSTELFSMRHLACSVNGTGLMTSDLVNSLKQLTQQTQLQFLTLLPWKNLFPQRNLLRQMKGWCPLCYQEWKENKQKIYDPLIWNINIVTICPYHQIYLSTNCCQCHQNLPIFPSNSRHGYCPKCQTWLGSTININHLNQDNISQEELEWDLWITDQIQALLTQTPQLFNLLSIPDIISQCLRYYIQQLTQENITHFASYLNIRKNKIWMWQKGDCLPQIDMTLKICFDLNLSLIDFLNRKNIDSKSDIINYIPNLINEQNIKTKKNPKVFNQELIKHRLHQFLSDNTSPPLSVTKIAKILGHNRRVILRHFPTLCQQISAKYLAYQKQCRIDRINKACAEVCQAVKVFYDKGMYPTEQKIASFLNQEGIFRDKEVRVAFHQIRKKLHLEP